MEREHAIEELREAVRRKYHFYVQVSTQFQMMGKGPHRVRLYEQVMQATKEWKLAQQQFLYHVKQNQVQAQSRLA